ncbi:tail fiber domain-containing protein [Bradyrhizobium sp. 200]|uniref:tail fiber domain-containing protein n=1 Tax=Bradyrhizobium sp. 200 TaxID=2782665 RepID=UPI001FFF0B80|nr:tail fiber domain-containing protein [Bradyrhizobium sp. 200]UPJ50383.1 tail fiber domain-containing protein [Bradyrhizobium sp. 200]
MTYATVHAARIASAPGECRSRLTKGNRVNIIFLTFLDYPHEVASGFDWNAIIHGMKSVLSGLLTAILSIFGMHHAPQTAAVATAAASPISEQRTIAAPDFGNPLASTSPPQPTPVRQSIAERLVVPPQPQTQPASVTAAELEDRLKSFESTIEKRFFLSNWTGASASGGGSPNTIALSNKIDRLGGTTLSNVTISGASGLTDSDIPDSITASNYLSLAGGTTAGALSITDAAGASTAATGTERVIDGNFAIDPTSLWSLGSGWSWDSGNSRAAYSGSGGPISAGNTLSGNNQPSTPAAVSIDSGGAGYTAGDTITISTGSADATYTVSSVSAGKVAGLTQVSGGTSYIAGSGKATTGGTGTGLVVSVNFIADASPLTQTITTNSSDATTSYPSRMNGSTISGVTYSVSFTIQNYSGSGWVRADIGSAASNMYPYPSYYYRSNGTYTVLLTSPSATLSFTPTADFVGAITNVSVTPVSPTASVLSIKNTDGSTGLEIRPGGKGIYNLNTFIGIGAGQNTTNAFDAGLAYYGPGKNEGQNVAIGYHSLYYNTTGAENTAIGAYALYSNTTGVGNTALSYDSMYSNTTGINNTAVGVSSLWANTTGIANTAYGTTALHFNTTGSNNVALGNTALYSNTTGTQNTALGGSALFGNTNGTNNTAVGWLASQLNTTGSNNTTVGASAGRFTSIGTQNAAFGASALQANLTGSDNAVFGYRTLLSATTSTQNTAVGSQALQGSTAGALTISGSANVAIGYQTLKNYIDGSKNTAIGYQAMLNATTSTTSVAVGYQAGKGSSTNDNFQGLTALGYQAGANLSNASDYNTLIGFSAGNLITTGAGNIWIGAASTTSNSNVTTGYANIAIGNNIKLPSATGNYQLNIGNLIYGSSLDGTGTTLSTGSIGIGSTTPWRKFAVTGTVGFDGLTGSTGAGSLCLSANREVVYNSASDSCLPSLRALKHDIASLSVDALGQIAALQPVSFIYNDDASSTVRYGFIAEDTAIVDTHLATYNEAGVISGVDDRALLAIVVSALQNLIDQIGEFADRFTTKELTFTRATGDELDVHKLCLDDVCITKDQLRSLLDQAGQAAAPTESNASTPSNDEVATTTVSDAPSITPDPTPPTDEPVQDATSSSN